MRLPKKLASSINPLSICATMLTDNYSKLKLTILFLLSLNIVLFGVFDDLTSTMDALSWVALLVMYELDAIGAGQYINANIQQKIRNALILVIALVFLKYLYDQQWLDIINGSLWLVLIGLLELEIRWPEKITTNKHAFWLATLSIFAGLLGMVAVWLWKSAWLDAYDAALWIIAFGLIEVDIFRFLKLKPGE
jgi:hypothetical protein